MATGKDEEHKPDVPERQEVEVRPIPGVSSQMPEGKKAFSRHRSTDDSFTGRAAQLAVMAELLRFHCNAAIPEIDLGTDVFAFRDDREEVVRLQVKSCTVPHEYVDNSGYSATFALPMKQFRRLDDRPPLYYVLAVRHNNKWVDFLVVSRARLQTFYNGKTRFGSYKKKRKELSITVEFRAVVGTNTNRLSERLEILATPPTDP